MLAGFADIPPVARRHFETAKTQCCALYESCQPGEEEEIITYRTIIQDALRDLIHEKKDWKLEEGISVSSSDSFDHL